MRGHSRRGAAALALVLAVLGVGSLVAFTVAGYRRQTTHQIAQIEAREATREVAESTLEAAASGTLSTRLLETAAEVDAFLAAMRNGEQVGGISFPEDPGLTTEPPAIHPDLPGWVVSPVGYRALEYTPSRNLGVLRMQVEVTRNGRTAHFAHDYEFTMRSRGAGGLALVLAEAPLERIYP